MHQNIPVSFMRALMAWKESRPCEYANFSRLCVSIQTEFHAFTSIASTSTYGTPERFSRTLDKLNIFDPCIYIHLGISAKRVVYLDADTFAQDECVSDLFNLRHFMEPAFANDILFPDSFNTGVMLIRPDHRLFKMLWEENRHTAGANHSEFMVAGGEFRLAYGSELYSYDGGDQGVLNAVFGSMRTYDPMATFVYHDVYFDARHQLPFRYNALLYAATLHEKEWDRMKRRSGVCVVHFSGRTPKPFERIRDPAVRRYIVSSPLLLEYYERWYAMYAEVELDGLYKPTVFMDIYL